MREVQSEYNEFNVMANEAATTPALAATCDHRRVSFEYLKSIHINKLGQREIKFFLNVCFNFPKGEILKQIRNLVVIRKHLLAG